MAKDKYSDGTYRYGFNGQEKDGEFNDNYDFGGRIYDPRLGRWLARDPQASRYASFSPYHFGYCNPIIVIDPNGEENIVVVGGADVAGKDRDKFFNSGLRAFIDLSGFEPKEQTTLVVVTAFMNEDEKNKLSQIVHDPDYIANRNVNIVFIENADQLTNYVNSKSTTGTSLSEERKADQITDIQIYGHGYPGTSGPGPTFEAGHGANSTNVPSGEDETAYHDKFTWGLGEVEKLDPNAFKDPKWRFETCNAATTCEDGANKGKNLVQAATERTGGKGMGWYGKSNYAGLYPLTRSFHDWFLGKIGPSQAYPGPGMKNDKSGESERKKYENGKEVE